MANTYDKGDLVKVTGTFTDPDSNDALIDPTVVKVSVKEPDGTTTTYTYGTDAECVKVSTGLYKLEINCDAPGTWHYRWWSTGTGQAAEPDEFIVEPSVFD